MFFSLIVLGIIQGLTEFLPVSSSGHIVLFGKLFGLEENLLLSIILHVATLGSILVVYRKDALYFIKHPFSNGVKKLVVATIPTCVIALVLMPVIEKSFGGGGLTFCFLFTAFLLSFTDLFFTKRTDGVITRKEVDHEFSGINYHQAIIMGIAQGFAIFPGVSRSGSTICAGLISKADKNEVASFSFLMSVPIIILSLTKEIVDSVGQNVFQNLNVFGLIIAVALAFIIGIFAINIMQKLTKKISFLWFGVYLMIVAGVSFFV